MTPCAHLSSILDPQMTKKNNKCIKVETQQKTGLIFFFFWSLVCKCYLGNGIDPYVFCLPSGRTRNKTANRHKWDSQFSGFAISSLEVRTKRVVVHRGCAGSLFFFFHFKESSNKEEKFLVIHCKSKETFFFLRFSSLNNLSPNSLEYSSLSLLLPKCALHLCPPHPQPLQ